jgi:hypothetical protein
VNGALAQSRWRTGITSIDTLDEIEFCVHGVLYIHHEHRMVKIKSIEMIMYVFMLMTGCGGWRTWEHSPEVSWFWAEERKHGGVTGAIEYLRELHWSKNGTLYVL